MKNLKYSPIPLEHLDAYYDLLNDESLAVNAGSVPHPITRDWARDRLIQRLEGEKKGTLTDRGLYLDGVLVGSSGFFFRDHGLEIGYAIHRDHRGKGLATLAAKLAVQSAREKRHKGPISANYFKDNPASGRVLEKAGFSIVGEEMGQSAARVEQTPAWCARLEQDVALVEPVVADMPFLFEIQHEPAVRRFAGSPHACKTQESFEAQINAITQKGGMVHTLLFEGVVAGYIAASCGPGKYTPADQGGAQQPSTPYELTCQIAGEHKDDGIGARALAAWLERFEIPKGGLYAAVAKGDAAAKEALEKNGFVPAREGQLSASNGNSAAAQSIYVIRAAD